MHIVRSTIAGEDMLHTLAASYGYDEQGAQCQLEYRGVNDIYRYTDGRVSLFLKVYARKEADRQ
jgi:hypothetical protein